jgi:hypothetical protein
MDVEEWSVRVGKVMETYSADRNHELFEDLVLEPTTISTWHEFQNWFSPFKTTGCFRGHADAAWGLHPSFHRKIHQRWKVETETTTAETVEALAPEQNEKAILHDFQRAAHHHYATPLDYRQTVDWLALMQHHGAPTRMLDWTESPYVALFFAMQSSEAEEAALWAIDLAWLRKRSYEILRRHDKSIPERYDPEVFRTYVSGMLFKGGNPDVIVQATPWRNNERMQIQQGKLLCAMKHCPSFPATLLRMLVVPAPATEKQVVSKVRIKRDRRIEFLVELRRMNIHEGSLFPGLDGFARSLGANLEIDVARQREDVNDTLRRYLNEKAAHQ